MYNYYEAVKEDVLTYIKEEVDMNGMDLDELKERLYEELINEDRITGNASGSHTFCRSKAQKYVEENKDLVREACDDYGNHKWVANLWLTDDYELIDSFLRCYVLGSAIEMAIRSLANRFEIYRNYGVLGQEKTPVYTYGSEHCFAITSDKITVELPENEYFSFYESVTGKQMVESSWGMKYEINKLLDGKEKPYYKASDRERRPHKVYLKEVAAE